MILNAYRDRPATYPGTRLLESTYGIVGQGLLDLNNLERVWTITALYAPLPRRALGGIRAKLVDQKGFVTFCNQRDLEVMMGIAHPGAPCAWSGGFYVGDEDDRWIGFCCDDEDLLDDTFERECAFRAQSMTGVLLPPLEFERRVHGYDGYTYDVEETCVFVSDVDPDTGYYPDTRIETVARRWARSERKRVQWSRL